MLWDALQTLSHTLAWTLLHFLWQGALIGLLYVAGTRAASTVRQRHALALSSLLILLALPMGTFYLLHQGTTSAVSADVAAGSATSTASMMTVDAAAISDDTATGSWTYLLVFAWLAGALVIALRLLRDWRLLRTAIRTSTEPPADLVAMLERQIQRVGVGRRVRLRLTARITSAGVYGWLRPVILLPTALALCMPRDQLETLLAHELAHVRRADFLSNSLALLARTLLYFHPVVHRICRDLERTREQLCDDLVVSLDINRIKYARALSAAETFRQQVQVPVPLLTATGGELSERVHRILDIRASAHTGKERAPILLALTTIVVAVTGLSGTDGTRLLTVTRPEFQAAYAALMASQAPTLAVADVAIAPTTTWLPRFDMQSPEAIGDTTSPTATTTVDDSAPSASTAIATTEPATVSSPTTDTLHLTPVADAMVTTGLEPIALPEPILDTAMTIHTPAADAMTGDTSEQASPRVLRQVQPAYPRNARWEGVEGSVTLAYRVDDDGRPADIRVIAATPHGQFEESTIEALQRWRFAPGAGGEFQQSFDFVLGDRSHRCETRVGTRICR